MVLALLPSAAEVLNSPHAPYCSYARAQQFAAAWGAEFVDYGHAGHIHADTGLGDWADGQARLQALIHSLKNTDNAPPGRPKAR